MLSFVLVSLLMIPSAFGAHHFSELSNDGSVWRVDHFKVEEGKLQDFVETRSFIEKSQALKLVEKINQLNSNSKSLSHIQFVSTERKNNPLWVVKNQWSEAWENKYAEWVEANFDKEFYQRYNVTTDCADVAYSLRWIFSRIHNLPAAATLAGSGAVVSHEIARAEWSTLSTHKEWHQDKRFLKALDWLLDNVYTKTLYKDAYPVKISKETIRPGLIHLIGGHTEVFSSVSYKSDEIPMVVLSSTMPKAVRSLSSRPYLETAPIPKENGGLLRFRWPVMQGQSWNMIAKEKMNHHSLEQYDLDFCSDENRLAFCIIKKLGMSFEPDILAEKITQGLEESVAQRIDVVREGYAYCSLNDCAPGTQGWEDWSTPSRDKRLNESLMAASQVMNDIGEDQYYRAWQIKTKLSEEMDLNFSKFEYRLSPGLASYDPRDSVDARWALNPAAILKGLTSRLKIYEKERSVLIDKASVCRANPLECQKSVDKFNEYSSASLDYKMMNALLAWDTLCLTESCPESFDHKSMISKFWFQSPIPWHSLKLRQGQSPPAHAHLLPANTVQNGGEKYLILDEKKIYEIASKKTLKLSENFTTLGFDQFTNHFYGHNGTELVIMDDQFKTLKKLEIQFQKQKMKIVDMGGGELFVMPLIPMHGGYGKIPFWAINLNDLTARDLGLFTSMAYDQRKGKIHLLLKGDTNLILSSSSQGILQKSYTTLPESVSTMTHLKDDEFILTSYDRNSQQIAVLHLTPSSLHQFYEGRSAYVSRLSDEYFYIQDFTSNFSTAIFDNDLKPQFSELQLRPSYPLGDDGALFLRPLSGGRNQVYVGGKEFKALNVFSEGRDFIISANETQLTFSTMNGFVSKDYSGNIVYKHPFIMKGNCKELFSTCQDPENKMWMENFMVSNTPEASSFTSVGLKGSGDPFLYLVTRYGRGMGYSSSDEMATIPATTNIGRHIDLGNGYLMWFPK